RAGLVADQQIDVGHLVAVAGQRFPDVHRHGHVLPWRCLVGVRNDVEGYKRRGGGRPTKKGGRPGRPRPPARGKRKGGGRGARGEKGRAARGRGLGGGPGRWGAGLSAGRGPPAGGGAGPSSRRGSRRPTQVLIGPPPAPR